MNDPNAPGSFKTDYLRVGEAQERWEGFRGSGCGWGGGTGQGEKRPLDAPTVSF